MGKITAITEGISGSTAATIINEAMETVETGAGLTGLGTVASPLKAIKTQQTLTSATSISMDLDDGQNAYLSLGHNTTLTLSNLFTGAEGNIVIDNTASYTLAISPTPYVIDDGAGAISLTSSGRDILSYYYDGTELNITYGSNYTKS